MRAASAEACSFELGEDRRAFDASLLADLSRLGAGLGQLRVVALERLLRAGLRLFGALEPALDRVATGVEPGDEPRQHLPGEEGEDDDEREGAVDEVGRCRQEQVGLFLGWYRCYGGECAEHSNSFVGLVVTGRGRGTE